MCIVFWSRRNSNSRCKNHFSVHWIEFSWIYSRFKRSTGIRISLYADFEDLSAKPSLSKCLIDRLNCVIRWYKIWEACVTRSFFFLIDLLFTVNPDGDSGQRVLGKFCNNSNSDNILCWIYVSIVETREIFSLTMLLYCARN